MNKFVKGCLITVLVLVIMGTIIGGIGFVLGGGRQAVEMAEAGELNYGGFNYSGDHGRVWQNRYSDEIEFDYEWDLNEKLSDLIYGSHEDSKAALGSDIHNLLIEIGGGDICVEEAEGDYFQIISSTTGKYQYFCEGNTFVMRGLEKLPRGGENKITLQIPKGKIFNEVDIEVGGAFVRLDSIMADTVNIEVGAGDIEVRNMETDELELDVGAGEFDAKNTIIRDGSFDLGIGLISYEGTINGDLDASCGMGSMELELTGEFEDHNYELDGAIGNISVGNGYNSGIGVSKVIDNNVGSNFELESGIGNLQINFK